MSKFKLIKDKTTTYLNKRIIGKYYLDDLEEYEYLHLNKKLSSKELDNLKYLKENNQLRLEDDAWYSVNDIIKRLNNLEKDNKIVFEITNKETFNKFIFNESIIDYKNISVVYILDKYYLKDYMYYESLLYKMIEPAKDLSPFERYIYAYNVVKNFKEYKESNRSSLSRNLYYVLEGEYAVCVGFCELLSDLLSKLGISSTNFSLIGKSKNKTWGHLRLYVNIKDDKYGINGFYVSDPTWDNDLKSDFYNHLALTNKEARLEQDFDILHFDDEFNVFDASSLDELHFKIVNIINEEKFNKLLNLIKKLDLDYYKVLESNFNIKKPNQKMINDLSMYIYNHINNEILGDTIMSAVEVVYRHSYGYKEEVLEEKLEEVRDRNSKRQNCLFPSKIKVNSDVEEDIIFLQNKFANSKNKVSKY